MHHTIEPLDTNVPVDIRDELIAAIIDLPEPEKILMGLYYEHSLSLSEISAVLDMPESKIKKIHSQVVARLCHPEPILA